MVSVNLGAGEFQHPVLTEKYNDNQWHHVVVERRSREIAILVDGLLQQTGATTGVFSMLSSNVLYVGGSANTFKLTQGKVNSNFRGCLKKVTYKADSISLDITELARTKHDLINIKGDVLFDKCENLVHSTPVTFATPESMVKVPYALAQKSGVITFQFQTNERNGLLMYSGSVQGSSDFFGLELLEGYLYLVLDLGSGAIKIQASTLMVTDGLPHKVMVTYNGKQGKVSVDGVEVEYTTKGNSEQLDLDGTLYIGAAAEGSQLPREMWVGSLGYGYVGCMQDVFIDGKVKDLSKFAEEQEIHGMTQECHPTRHQCTARPCLHDGICTEGWNRFLCDCSATGYFGPSCNEAATTLSFNGEQYVKISLPQESRAEAEDISLRFKTRRQGGLLFATLSQKTSDKMVLTLEGGRARLDVNLGSGSTTLYVGSGLSDDQWHTVHIRRRLTNIQLRVDRDIVENGKLVGAATLLRVNNLYLGSYTSGTEDGSKILDIDAIAAGGMQSDEESRHSNFAGQMQQFIFNKKPYFELAQTEAMSSFIEVTADFADTGPDATCSPNSCDNRGRCVQNWDTYVCNCDMTSFSGARCNEESIAYRFGDSRPGLIMFTYPESERPDTQTDHLAVGFSTTTNQERTTLLQVISGNSNDFVELELVNGIIFALYNMGTIPHPIGDTFTKVNDGKYHIVRFTRAGANSTIQVDDEPIQTKHPPGAQLGVFNNQAQIYVGGKMGRDGSIEAPFKGTMAGLVFNGKRVLDLAESNDAKITILGDVEKTNITSLLPVKITQATSQPAISTPPYSKSKNVQSTSPMKATSTGSIETTTAVPDTTTVKKPLTTKQVITTKRMTTITSIEQTTPYGSHTTDDIVFTGSGCSSDDEDCTNGSGSTDDIVIPTVEVSTPPILEVVTSRKPHSTTTPLPVTTSDCKEDEEDCGSGSGEGTTPDIFLPVPEVTPETTSPTEKTHQPETSSAGIQSTKSTTANPVVDTSLDGLTKTVIYETSRTVPVSTKTPPEGENTGQTLGGGGIHLGGMNIAVIIGIIVGVLVALLILIFIIYKVKKRSNGSYKIDESKNYADVKQPLQANGDKTHHVNGSSPAKTKKGDVKEWYV
ncbi:neurexin-2-like isoform X1 [Lingula anatina]|uniref:Neurexin-2-like isoform X1 n=1 Tax=Lingula anatina TaxID=7574 RepID=A0A1S3IDH6_LINAN|nr:neurexin-2-like isoform X1 [Lingula anatina]|eukprot:XP_013396315.1 neurexin-2-like isoform X1 [Lingula anatina]